MKENNLYNYQTLVQKIAAGDERAFSLFFDHYRPQLYTAAIRFTKNESIAEDIVQDVFVRIWNNRLKLPEINDIEAWVHTITRNRCLSALKKIATEMLVKGNLTSEEQDNIPVTFNLPEEKRIQQLLREGIRCLTPQQKVVFELYYNEGLTREKIAAKLSLSVETVRIHLRLAKRHLRAFLVQKVDILTVFLLLYLY